MVEEHGELEEPLEGLGEVPPEELEEDTRPVFLKDEEPSGKLNKAKYWILKGKTDEQLFAEGHNEGTVRIAKNQLVKEGYMKKPPRRQKPAPGTDLTPSAPGKATQIFAKGSPPEAIIEGISIPLVDGQAQGFEQGMKFGMSTLVLATRIMQELSTVAQGQVKPLIDLTRSVREGEVAAFKSGADEGAMKAAQAMGSTILPMMTEMQTAIASVGKGSEANPVQAMMTRVMEPMLKNLLGKVVPGMQGEAPSGWTKRTE